MNKLLIVALATALAGCAVPSQGPGYANHSRDPSQWRVVSVTPVPSGTAARIAATSPDGKPVEFSSSTVPQQIYSPAPLYSPAPVYSPAPIYSAAPVYGHAPVYAPAPIYRPAPVYYPEPAYYWPPVSLSLGFIFGSHRSHHGHGNFRGGRRHR
jgi:hypothetical protein